MNVLTCDIPGLLIIEPKVFGDARGFFLETWNRSRYRRGRTGRRLCAGQRLVLAPGHPARAAFPEPEPPGQTAPGAARGGVRCGGGHPAQFAHLREVARPGALGREQTAVLCPAGFAHGFAVLSETALFQYKCTESYSPKDELAIRWDDPDIGIKWPLKEPLLSERDAKGLRLQGRAAGPAVRLNKWARLTSCSSARSARSAGSCAARSHPWPGSPASISRRLT